MAKQKQKHYAVHNGRQGTHIYTTWEETKANVTRVPNVIYKSFLSREGAQAWLQGIADATAVDAPPPYHYPHSNQPALQHMPLGSPASAGPAAYVAVQHVPQVDDGDDYDMCVESYSDDEIPAGPPSSQSVYEDYEEEDSDIEILDGPPPDRGIPSRPQSRTHQRQQEPRAGPSRHATPPPAVVKLEQRQPKQELATVVGSGIDGAPAGLLTSVPVHEFQLSPDQLYVLDKVKKGESVFFTGSAGTGKSVLLREIIQHFGGRPSSRLGVTASTGIASINIGGCTLHSWAGIGLGKDDKDGLVGKIYGLNAKAYKADMKRRRELRGKKRKGEGLTEEEEAFLNTDPSKTSKGKILERWRQCEVLIIDEISMIDGKLFDKLEYVGRKLRKNQLPFGGIQLVLSGDFCQLPPVPDKSATGAPIPACFAFEADSWTRCVGPPIILRKVFRQKDQKFVDMLNAMRFGNLDEKIAVSFRKLSREVKYDDGIEPTELYPTRKEVENANSRRLNALPGEPRNYRSLDAPGRDENGRKYSSERVDRALKDVIAPETLPLKIGAQVMLIKNIIQGLLVNGSIGRVVAFYKPRDAVAKGAHIAIPDNQQGLRKAFGMEDEKKDAGADPNEPQRALEKLQEKAQAEQREQKLKAILALDSVWPCVKFHSGPLMLCVPLSFEVINADGNVEAVREQVPLILAWALSIHKSQGQTLERVRVDLARTFEKGQAYVALSRATRMESLQVLNFDPSKVQAHPRVLQWMSKHMSNMPELPYRPRDEIDEELEYWADML